MDNTRFPRLGARDAALQNAGGHLKTRGVTNMQWGLVAIYVAAFFISQTDSQAGAALRLFSEMVLGY